MNYDTIFDYVWYFNKTTRVAFEHRKHRNQSNSSFQSNSEIEITHFYYLNLKCFEIDLKIRFDEEDSFRLPTRNILGVYFNNTLVEKNKVVFLFRNNKQTKQFSDSMFYKLRNDEEGGLANCTYEVVFELFEIVRRDHFETLKNLRSLFYSTIYVNDVTEYLDNLSNRFKRQFGYTTRNILLENTKNDDYDVEIKDGLFVQYYLQVQNVTDHQRPISLNAKQNLSNVYTHYGFNRHSKPGIVFGISLSKRRTVITNEENYSKLIQSVLTTLSLWLNINILDLFDYVDRSRFLIKRFYDFLIRLKAVCRTEINHFLIN